MVNSVIASLALFGASASALSVGSAKVINMCSYDVYLCNVPSADGGYEQHDQNLAAGASWEQQWTELSNGNGWSIKLSKSDSLENILQYEYTFHNDGIIWYDLSCVNGNPWDGNWEITSSTDNCNPKQQAYRYATDDAYGMQSCDQDASITVTLCSGEAADNSTSGSQPPVYSSASIPEYTSTTEAAAPAYTPPSEAPAPAYTPEAHGPLLGNPGLFNWNNKDAAASEAAAAKPTTLATAVTTGVVAGITDAPGGHGNVVVEWATEIVTEIVTAQAGSPSRVKRHAHHAHQHRNYA